MKLKKCAVCGSTENLHHHHFIPISLGGKDEDENILTLCIKHHNFIHKLEGNKWSINHLDHKKLCSVARAKKTKNNEYVGGIVPYGYKVVETGEVRVLRSRKKTKIKKLEYDVGGKDYKMLEFILTQRLKHKPITYRNLEVIVMQKFNKVIGIGRLWKLVNRELQKEHWNYLRS